MLAHAFAGRNTQQLLFQKIWNLDLNVRENMQLTDKSREWKIKLIAQWGSKYQTFEYQNIQNPDKLLCGIQMVWFSNGWAIDIILHMQYLWFDLESRIKATWYHYKKIVLTIWKPTIWNVRLGHLSSGWAVKFWDDILKLDHLSSEQVWTIWIPDLSGIWIPTV